MRLSPSVCLLLAYLQCAITTQDVRQGEGSGSASKGSASEGSASEGSASEGSANEGSASARSGSARASVSRYSTKEVREMCLEEWAGKTQEVQDYFNQLPSEEFKENSEDLKLKFYYERMALEDVDSTHTFNITPQVRTYSNEHTVEVNDSYVPRYRMTTSEEIRIEEDGTFHSKERPDSTLEHFESQTVDSSEIRSISMSEPTDSSGSNSKGSNGKEKWPKNMDPKEKRKKKTKSEEQTKKKELVKNELNGVNQLRSRTKNSIRRNTQGAALPARNQNQNLPNRRINNLDNTKDINFKKERVNLRSPYGHVQNLQGHWEPHDKPLLHRTIDLKTGKINKLDPKLKERMLGKDATLKNTLRKRKDSSAFDHFMGTCKLRHKHKHHQRNPRARRRPIQGNLQPRPFL